MQSADIIYSNFNGLDEYVDIIDVNIGRTYTVSAWIKYDGDDGIILGASTGGFAKYMFFTLSGVLFVNRGSDAQSWPFTPTIGEWYNLVTVRNNTTSETLYINGVNQGNRTFVTNIDMEIWYIGINRPGLAIYRGGINEVTTWNAAMNDSQVSELYDLRNAEGLPLSHSLSANLTHHWRLRKTNPLDQVGTAHGTSILMDSSNILNDNGDFEDNQGLIIGSQGADVTDNQGFIIDTI